MDDEIENINEQENKDIWIVMIYLILMQQEYETHKLWDEFANEVKKKSRFFPQSDFLTKIEAISGKASYILKEGEVLYRARELLSDAF